ncbi:alginate export family protein [Chryseolinea sp. Jin1]|uniref:Alginate export family protein n=2 Tax=Chryseolinea lacunae TaxID=2801331 RepID=A0ABS1KKW4_9BACT|nr:alginate export family protein [Chryseolinea lacunae]
MAQQAFKHLRYDENYSFLKDSSRSWYEQMKYMPRQPSAKSYLSFGGEVRYQYFKFNNEAWGDAPEDIDGYLLNRLLLHADLHLGRRVRVFTQLQSSVAAGRIDPSPVEMNPLDLHQIFLDVALASSAEWSVVSRVGRQEFNYGSSRLVSTREGPNNRQSFDAAKVMLKHGHVKADVFFADYVQSRDGIFDDKFLNDNVKFGGAYFTATDIPVLKNVDVYYLGIEKKKTTWSDVTGHERRHSVGTRLWSSASRLQYDVEAVFQFGDMEDNSIRAWTLSYNLNYALGKGDAAPTIGLKTELISGDKNKGDGKINSFNPLYPRGAYFGYAALIGPSNLFDIHPSLALPLCTSLSFSLDYDIFWRYSSDDGIYNPGTQVIYPSGDSRDRFIGHQISGTFEFAPNKFIYLRSETTWFKSGEYLKAVGSGKDIFYTGITTTFRF